MLPLRDVIPSRTVPGVTIVLIALNTIAFLYELTLSGRELEALAADLGLVPAHFSWTAVLSSMFLHGAWVPFLANMLFLWIFGENVEDRAGHGRFLVLYLGCGTVAALVYAFSAPDSPLPLLGASGAVAGVLGAYFVMFPRSRVLTVVPMVLWIEVVEVPALLLLGFWFVLQLASGAGSLAVQTAGETAGLAFLAQAGGFVAGAAAIPFLRRPERLRAEWWDPFEA